MSSIDDSQINYSSSSSMDWRMKYNEAADMLAETRAELDDFHHASKELEAELENELQRTEKAQQELKVKVARAETERDDWKSKFMSLQTTHNTTTTSLQRELDQLRQEHQRTKVQLRELEMGNDDLERNERAVSSSLADIEAKYSRALEEKILLEHELLDKASLEEECQRLKDEIRDANVEISILKDQIAAQSTGSVTTDTSSAPSSLFPHVPSNSDDNLLSTPPPPDLQLSDLAPSSESLPSVNSTPRPNAYNKEGQSTLLQRAGFYPTKATPPQTGISSFSRSSTLPSLFNGSPSIHGPRTPVSRPAVSRNPSSSTTSTTSTGIGTASKNKGVQMVSEMRARVRNLEQKIHTRVPRLRMGSVVGRANPSSFTTSTLGPLPTIASPSTRYAPNRYAVDEQGNNSPLQRWSADSMKRPSGSDSDKNQKKTDSSGWVLIMEDSPSPAKDKDKERRRISSPSAPTSFRPASSSSTASSTSPSFGNNKPSSLYQSTMNTGIRRPQSRLSGASLSTTATTSSIPTPTSRPSTPTYLPVPTSGLYAHSSTAGVTGLKRSTGPGATNLYGQTKRSSLGSSTATPNNESPRPISMPPPPLPSSAQYSDSEGGKALPQLPAHHANVTVRSSKLPSTTSTSLLSKSRIGRPSSGTTSGRRSTGDADGLLDAPNDKKEGRPRAGSTAAAFSKRGS